MRLASLVPDGGTVATNEILPMTLYVSEEHNMTFRSQTVTIMGQLYSKLMMVEMPKISLTLGALRWEKEITQEKHNLQ